MKIWGQEAPQVIPMSQQKAGAYRKRLLAILATVAVLLLLLVAIWQYRQSVEVESFAVVNAESSAVQPLNPAASITDAETVLPAKITVHISGAVAFPGVYQLDEGSRVNDAVVAAGGQNVDAAADSVNLARILSDGEHVHIPSQAEVEAGEHPAEYSSAQDAASSTAAPADALININSADAATLETLPGIGPAMAQRIISYRQTYGPFASIEELQLVSGIGEKRYADLKDKVCV
jgi:competence protein ComEA